MLLRNLCSAFRTFSTMASSGPVEASIRSKLTTLLRPSSLIISNDSWQHRHHAAMRAQNGGSGETHFSVEVVSSEFEGKTTIQRHRMVHAALSGEFTQGLHSLSLKTRTPSEVQPMSPGSH
ncbi:bola-like protein [Dendrothele bispora CBS 962.96]|uniref:Bola-like protein n=1 Tax=Dendrothele bispora (strain CBS 962.96) TaxID=1314807 RepID=A0A4S8M048_DENBC|nr:bola-like protein [Dendrothele bispora CBS 962.96]